MAHGLQRSISRGRATGRGTINDSIQVNGAVSVVAVSTAIGFGSIVISDFPEGNILLLGLAANLSFSGTGADANLVDTWEGDFGIGTTPASDATITAGDVDILASTAIGPATAEVIASARFVNTTTEQGAIFDNTAGALEVNLSLLIDAADITDDETAVITVAGNVFLAYVVLGDD